MGEKLERVGVHLGDSKFDVGDLRDSIVGAEKLLKLFGEVIFFGGRHGYYFFRVRVNNNDAVIEEG